MNRLQTLINKTPIIASYSDQHQQSKTQKHSNIPFLLISKKPIRQIFSFYNYYIINAH